MSKQVYGCDYVQVVVGAIVYVRRPIKIKVQWGCDESTHSSHSHRVKNVMEYLRRIKDSKVQSMNSFRKLVFDFVLQKLRMAFDNRQR